MHFFPPIESPRTEWFIFGTETSEIKLISANNSETQMKPKILYPTSGTIIAMDPDIPVNHQRLQFDAKGTEEISWQIDGSNVGNGINVSWAPTGGRHRLALIDLKGNELDRVTFEVRGAIHDPL